MQKAIDTLRSLMEIKARMCGKGVISLDDYFNISDDLLHFLESAVFWGVITESEKEKAWHEILKNTRSEYLKAKKEGMNNETV